MLGEDKFCVGCKHYLNSSDVSEPMCIYILNTGKARSLICPPGKYCTVRELRRKQKTPLKEGKNEKNNINHNDVNNDA